VPTVYACGGAWRLPERCRVDGRFVFHRRVIHVSASVEHFDELRALHARVCDDRRLPDGLGSAGGPPPVAHGPVGGGASQYWHRGSVGRVANIGVPIARIPWVPEAVGAADVTATVVSARSPSSSSACCSAPRVEFARRAVSWLPGLLLTLLVVSVLYGLVMGTRLSRTDRWRRRTHMIGIGETRTGRVVCERRAGLVESLRRCFPGAARCRWRSGNDATAKFSSSSGSTSSRCRSLAARSAR